MGIFIAVESESQIRQAVKAWADKFSRGARPFTFRRKSAFAHDELGVWGSFGTYQHKHVNYWNVFGLTPEHGPKNLITEINPPIVGKSEVVGVVARDQEGSRWILHRGRLHPAHIRITEEMFDAATGRKRVNVRFSDGTLVPYYPVANLDAPAGELADQIAGFVRECSIVRLRYTTGKKAAVEERIVEKAEEGLFPEFRGKYLIAPQTAKVISRSHGDVWQALTKELERRNIPHSNGRVGRYGPDLRTLKKPLTLFEIKTDGGIGDVQQAVGQLFLYETLLHSKHRKVLTLPHLPAEPLREAIRALGLHLLHYTRRGRRVTFDSDALKQLFH